MAPFNVERRFQLPVVRARAARVDRRIVRRAILGDAREVWRIWNSELRVEGLQLAENIRRIIGIDDGDRLPAAVSFDPAVEGDLREPIGLLDLRRLKADRRRTAGRLVIAVGMVENRRRLGPARQARSRRAPGWWSGGVAFRAARRAMRGHSCGADVSIARCGRARSSKYVAAWLHSRSRKSATDGHRSSAAACQVVGCSRSTRWGGNRAPDPTDMGAARNRCGWVPDEDSRLSSMFRCPRKRDTYSTRRRAPESKQICDYFAAPLPAVSSGRPGDPRGNGLWPDPRSMDRFDGLGHRRATFVARWHTKPRTASHGPCSQGLPEWRPETGAEKPASAIAFRRSTRSRRNWSARRKASQVAEWRIQARRH